MYQPLMILSIPHKYVDLIVTNNKKKKKKKLFCATLRSIYLSNIIERVYILFKSFQNLCNC
jgi:hypothetical protein